MNRKDVALRLKKIHDMRGDDEMAHMEEKALWEDVLRAIAEGSDCAQDLARLALLTERISFSRWYA